MTGAAPLLFVMIWATGFVVARLVAGHADPLTFLAMRFVLTAAAFTAISLAVGAAWPCGFTAWRDRLVTGVLLQAIFLGGVFWSVGHGLPAGISALVTGLQPLLTAVLAFPLLGEIVGARRWAGIAAGFVGAVLVITPQLRLGSATIAVVPVLVSGLSMVAITLGTLWQKRTGGAADLRTSGAVQFIGASLVAVPVAALAENGRFDGSWQADAGLAWSVLGLSLGASSLLLLLIKRGAVSGVASLFYMVPPVVAVMAYALFGDRLEPVQVVGMAVAAAGVAIASRVDPKRAVMT